MAKKGYEGDDIQVVEGRDAVRMRPGMYIGGTDKASLHHLIWEIVDNSVDEAMNGHASEINVTLHASGDRVTVKDDGRGIPLSIEKKTGRPAVEVVFTKLHAGAKFDGGSYKSSGGLNGVGASVTNFLSKDLSVRVFRDEVIHQLAFEQGILTQELEEVGTYSKHSRQGTGTEVTFAPDPEIFPSVVFDPVYIRERLEVKTYINPGLKITFTEEATKEKVTFHHPDGIVEFLTHMVTREKATPVHTPAICIAGEPEGDYGLEYEVALQWTEDTSETCLSFVNSIPTPQGGTHESGFRDALYAAVRAYMETSSDVPKKLTIRAEDIREGIKAIVNLKTEGEKQFQSQNKVKLTNPEIQPRVSGDLKVKLESYLFSNPSTADVIVQRIVASARAREASRSIAKKARSSKKNARKLTLPGKLADCSSNEPSECEIFLVEGDSAGGNAKVARNRETQAILPLRGKVLNAETAKSSSVLKNKELSGIVEALGCGVGDTLDLDDLRYHKVILLMDADSDGHHISTLLLTFFYRYMPELIEEGHVYIAAPPLYRIMHGKDRYWAETDAEKENLIQKLTLQDARKSIEVSRFKGLGEMMANTLKETALDPATRSLIRVEIQDGTEEDTDDMISSLMGKDASARQALIEENLTDLDSLDF
jgi:DNA gyrase/topoisomerase IV subunit B